ncbi:MAG: hypothetical protein R2795_09990 [Saprospiraceae bacterium]
MANKLPEALVFKDFQLIDFKSIDYRQLLTSDSSAEVVLTILSDFQGDAPAEAVIRMVLQRLRQLSDNEQELKSWFAKLTILSRLRKLEAETVKNVSDMPITIDIKQDYLYNQGLWKANWKANWKVSWKASWKAS